MLMIKDKHFRWHLMMDVILVMLPAGFSLVRS